jgi:CRP/FNR family transcriptional regulator, cyclic AMP receptor protein
MTGPTRPQASAATFSAKNFLGRAEFGKKISIFEKGQKIFTQGEVADSVFYIQKGKVKVTVLSESGKEAVVGILAQGQFFGEGCLDGANLRTSTSHAMEQCLLTSLTKTLMIATLNTEPKFSAFFVAYLLARITRVEDDLVDQLFNSSERRLARLLLLLWQRGRFTACPDHA